MLYFSAVYDENYFELPWESFITLKRIKHTQDFWTRLRTKLITKLQYGRNELISFV